MNKDDAVFWGLMVCLVIFFMAYIFSGLQQQYMEVQLMIQEKGQAQEVVEQVVDSLDVEKNIEQQK